MKYTLALPVLMALAAPAAASTLTQSYDIRLTPYSVSFYDQWHVRGSFQEGDPGIATFASVQCGDSGREEKPISCYSESDADISIDLVEMTRLNGSIRSSHVPVTSVTGQISFGPDHAGCTGDIAVFIWACGQAGVAGGQAENSNSSGWWVGWNATAIGFELWANNGMSVYEYVSSGYGDVFVDGSMSISFAEMEFSTILPGYRLSYGVELLLDLDQPATLPSPVPLPASLPLLAGALVVAGAVGRRQQVSPR